MRIHWFLLTFAAVSANATEYSLSSADALIFGDTEVITAFGEDTLPDLARRYSLGYEEIQRANPSVDLWLPGEGTPIVIPGQRLLPPGPRVAMTVVEMRMNCRYPNLIDSRLTSSLTVRR